MKLAFQLAYKNLVGTGLRTLLNVIVLSFAFVMIIFFNGMLDGWNQQAKKDTIEWEYGNGHLLHENYDPLDPFSLEEGHGKMPTATDLNPVLIRQATIYPEGRMVSTLLKGFDTKQDVLKLSTQSLASSDADFPAIIGKQMAASAKLKKGDEVLMRWRDKDGTFDAGNITIVDIFDCDVMSVDKGQIWISIEQLWEITGLDNHATMLVANNDYEHQETKGWIFKSQKELLRTIEEIISMKKYSSSFMYLMLLAIALLAIFDTQVLSIFRRQREIGTYISLGMTRSQVVGLFTVEGSMYSLFAMILGCLYGIPLFIYFAKNGIAMPAASQDMGVALAERIFPVYGIGLILGTIFIVIFSATIVSFLPTRKISKMNIVDALKGKLQ
jgi:putative ABC transport system permease protein